MAPSPTVTSVSVVSGPISQRPPMRVAPSSWVPGWTTVSRPMVTSTSIHVVAGSTIGHARPLMGGDDAPVQLGGQLGQLHPVVDARHQRGVVDVLGPHDPAVLPDDGDHVGEVELLLGVVRPQPAQRRAQHLDVEGVHACVDLADGLLRRGGVGLLDDADDLAVLGAQDAAVARRVGQRRRQHRRGGGSELWAAIRSARVSASSSGTSPEVTTTMPAKSSGSAASPQATACPVPSCCSCTAMSIGAAKRHRRARRRRARCARGRGRPPRRGAAGAALATACSDVRQHAAAGQGVQHLRGVRAHPGAGSGRQDQDRGFAMRSVMWSPSPRTARVRRRRRFSVSFRGRSRQCSVARTRT